MPEAPGSGGHIGHDFGSDDGVAGAFRGTRDDVPAEGADESAVGPNSVDAVVPAAVGEVDVAAFGGH